MDLSTIKEKRISVSLLSFVICFVAFLLIDTIFFADANEGWRILPALAASIATAGVTYFMSSKSKQSQLS